MGLGIGLGPGFDYFRQYNVIRRIGIRRNGAEPFLERVSWTGQAGQLRTQDQQLNRTALPLGWRNAYRFIAHKPEVMYTNTRRILCKVFRRMPFNNKIHFITNNGQTNMCSYYGNGQLSRDWSDCRKVNEIESRNHCYNISCFYVVWKNTI